MDVFEFIVSGQHYSVRKEAVLHGPTSKLTELCRNDQNIMQICIDRQPDLFCAILALYQTGSLHIPMSVCPGAFLEEMEYWDIKQDMLTTCCFYRLQCFLNEQENLKKFRKHVFGDDDVVEPAIVCCSAWDRIRRKIWAVVDYKERTLLSRIYFIVALIMILLSIITIACSTEGAFKRAMTNCERLEFMKSAGMEDFHLVSGLLGHHCESEIVPTKPPILLKAFPPEPHEFEDNNEHGDYLYIEVNGDSENAPQNVARFGAPQDMLNLKHKKNITKVKIPNMKVPIYSLVFVDIVTICFFTLEFILRLLSCPSILHYFFSVINVADAAALIGTYLHMLLMHLHKHEKYRDDWMDILEYMQMLRSLRLFRIVKNVKASRVLAYSIKRNVKDISVLLLFVVVGMCTFASIIYIPENKQRISSIPVGWYWAIITMTTVGYGDVTPETAVGKIIGCVCSLAGVLLFALTVPIFANNFVSFYQYVGLEAELVKRNKKEKKRISIDTVIDHLDKEENTGKKELKAMNSWDSFVS